MTQKNIIPKDIDSVDQTNYYWFVIGISHEEINRNHKYANKFPYMET